MQTNPDAKRTELLTESKQIIFNRCTIPKNGFVLIFFALIQRVRGSVLRHN